MPTPITYGVDFPNDRRGQALGRARARCRTAALNEVMLLDFLSSTEYEAGKGAIPYVVKTGGWIVADSTVVPGTVAVAQPAGQATPVAWINNPRTERWYAWAYAGATTAAGADSKIAFCLRDSGGGISPAFEFGSVGPGAGGTGNFSAQIYDNAATLVYDHNTGVAFDNAPHLWEIWNNGTDINFAIDGATVGTFAVGTVGTNPIRPELLSYNGTSAASRIIIGDYMGTVVMGAP